MSELKCPFCNLDIRLHRIYLDGCDNTRSPLWQELERTRKALEIAVDAIDVISLKYHKDTPSIFLIKYAQNAKEQITALEQKDVK